MREGLQYLLSLRAIRERSLIVYTKALKDKLVNFNVDMTRLDGLTDYVSATIKKSHNPDDFSKIPHHDAWNHFEVANGGHTLANLIEDWKKSGVDTMEQARRAIDISTVSVMIHVAVGGTWNYSDSMTSEAKFTEYLFDAFSSGKLSSDPESAPQEVHFSILEELGCDFVKCDLAVEAEKDIAAITNMLNSLGRALSKSSMFALNRPGSIADYWIPHSHNDFRLSLSYIWETLMFGLLDCLLASEDYIKEDCWSCRAMPLHNDRTSDNERQLIPFHMVGQWLCYSILIPLKRILGIKIDEEHLLTGLPEIRTCSLLIDFGVLKLKPRTVTQGLRNGNEGECTGIPVFNLESDPIVELRAVTIGFLDLLLEKVNVNLNTKISQSQLIESGTIPSGRRIAIELRGDEGNPPLEIINNFISL